MTREPALPNSTGTAPEMRELVQQTIGRAKHGSAHGELLGRHHQVDDILADVRIGELRRPGNYDRAAATAGIRFDRQPRVHPGAKQIVPLCLQTGGVGESRNANLPQVTSHSVRILATNPAVLLDGNTCQRRGGSASGYDGPNRMVPTKAPTRAGRFGTDRPHRSRADGAPPG